MPVSAGDSFPDCMCCAGLPRVKVKIQSIAHFVILRQASTVRLCSTCSQQGGHVSMAHNWIWQV